MLTLAKPPRRPSPEFPKVPQVGAIVSKVQFDRVMSYIESAKQEGARLLMFVEAETSSPLRLSVPWAVTPKPSDPVPVAW